jgi:hypothetical protein
MSTRLRLAQLACVVWLTFVLGGCAGGDTSMYVKNGSSESWYLSVSRGLGDPCCNLWVVKVAPGADTFALSWNGGPSVKVSVLGLDCSPVGSFRAAEDGTYVVDSVAGLMARIENHGGPFGSRTTTPGVEDTYDCGGFLEH